MLIHEYNYETNVHMSMFRYAHCQCVFVAYEKLLLRMHLFLFV